MIKKCIKCWNEFNTRKSKAKYCSVECRNKSQRLDDIKCIICWKTFHPSKSWVKTCSKECWYKSMSLWERECLNCWCTFITEHSYNKYCSKECSSQSHRKYSQKECIICWKKFMPHTDKHLCCSISCWQLYNRNRKTKEEKDNTIKNMIWWIKDISKINLEYCNLLEHEWFNIEKEFWVDMYRYDIKIWNILIEINPFPYHNSTWCPKIKWAKKKEKDYHNKKAECAINNWYIIIMVWDWINYNDVIKIIKNIKKTELWSISLHRYNKTTKEHIIDEWYNRDDMINKWFVEIYDAWERYIFWSTKI